MKKIFVVLTIALLLMPDIVKSELQISIRDTQSGKQLFINGEQATFLSPGCLNKCRETGVYNYYFSPDKKKVLFEFHYITENKKIDSYLAALSLQDNEIYLIDCWDKSCNAYNEEWLDVNTIRYKKYLKGSGEFIVTKKFSDLKPGPGSIVRYVYHKPLPDFDPIFKLELNTWKLYEISKQLGRQGMKSFQKYLAPIKDRLPEGNYKNKCYEENFFKNFKGLEKLPLKLSYVQIECEDSDETKCVQSIVLRPQNNKLSDVFSLTWNEKLKIVSFTWTCKP